MTFHNQFIFCSFSLFFPQAIKQYTRGDSSRSQSPGMSLYKCLACYLKPCLPWHCLLKACGVDWTTISEAHVKQWLDWQAQGLLRYYRWSSVTCMLNSNMSSSRIQEDGWWIFHAVQHPYGIVCLEIGCSEGVGFIRRIQQCFMGIKNGHSGLKLKSQKEDR